MKKTIKNVLLILWVLISLRILWLSGPYTLGYCLSILVKIFNIPKGELYISTFLPFTGKEYVLGPVLSQYTFFLSMLRGFTDLLLVTFILNTWVFFALIRPQKTLTHTFNTDINKKILISLVCICFYFWYIQDIFVCLYLNEVVHALKNTNFFYFLIFLIFGIIFFNILMILQIINKNFSLKKKMIYLFLLLFINGTICQTVFLALIHENGILGLTLYNSDIINSPFFKGPKELNEILYVLYESYGLNISWCHPLTPSSDEPCSDIRKRLEASCTFTEITNHLPLGGKTIRGQVVSQALQLGIDKYEGCSEIRKQLEVCMQIHMRAEFARRWVESHPQITPKLHMDPIDTWSKYTKK